MAIATGGLYRNNIATSIKDSINSQSIASGDLKLRIYSGSLPASFGGASGTLLATVLFVNPPSISGSNIVTLQNPASINAVATGTAGWFRLLGKDTDLLEGTITVSGGGGDLILSTLSIVSGQTVDLADCTLTVP